MEKLPEDRLIILVDLDATCVGYMNLYDPGDIWVKTKGCEGCPAESQRRCCGRCGHWMPTSGICSWHVEKGDQTSGKPFVCVVRPVPDSAKGFCQQEYLCIKGKHKGKTRRTADIRNVASDGTVLRVETGMT